MMNKIMLAMVLAGAAASVQAAPQIASDGAEASVTVTAPSKVVVSNVLTPVSEFKTGDVVLADVANGLLSADDGLPHNYAVTFPDDIIDNSSSNVRAKVKGTNNPNNSMIIELSKATGVVSPGTNVDGKKYLLLPNTEGSSEVSYAVTTSSLVQQVPADNYNIRTQAYVYSE